MLLEWAKADRNRYPLDEAAVSVDSVQVAVLSNDSIFAILIYRFDILRQPDETSLYCDIFLLVDHRLLF